MNIVESRITKLNIKGNTAEKHIDSLAHMENIRIGDAYVDVEYLGEGLKLFVWDGDKFIDIHQTKFHVVVESHDDLPIEDAYIDETIQIKKDPPSVLDEAEKIIDGDREQLYGKFDKNLVAITRLWNGWLISNDKLASDSMLSIFDVCCMMMLLKIARLNNDPTHRDSIVDVCGYARLLEKCGQLP
jgi:hypothetical protein